MIQPEYIHQFWSLPTDGLVKQLGASPIGLSTSEAKRRIRIYGPNRIRATKRTDTLTLFLAQFKSPLILILLGAVILSFFLGEPVDASIIIAIILLSSVLGFWQEKRAADAVKSLLAIVKIEVRVLRDGVEIDISAEEVVPGDICILNAGDIIPGDAAILDSKDLFVDEACLTGESFPAEKQVGIVAASLATSTALLITKGAVSNVLDLCSSVELPSGCHEMAEMRKGIERQFTALGNDGFRTLGLAYKRLGDVSKIGKQHEVGMTFVALLVFFDPPKAGVIEALSDLRKLGIALKVITGDNVHVATSVARNVLEYEPRVLTGRDLRLLSNEALRSRAPAIDVFAEIEPSQKERIILALRKSGNTVGFLGDGINDASALHSADVGISVDCLARKRLEGASSRCS